MIEPAELVLRVVLGAVLGGVVGLERELADQPAGFRTHMLVSLGAALFTLAGAYGVESFGEGPVRVQFDPTRVAAQVVAGIGFLGAGAIIRHGANVRGLTTAASLWVTAAIGMAVALGFWPGALAAVVTTVVVLYGLGRLERRMFQRLKADHFRLAIRALPEFRLSDLTDCIESCGGKVESVQVKADARGHHELAVTLTASPQGRSEMVEALAGLDGIAHLDWSGL
ncbi:MAG: MgtC/SapB family protein [Actinomycetota bacterium]